MTWQRADPEELERLTEVFRRHGACRPESMARSQLQEGIPQLAIFCFTKSLWEGVIPEGDVTWIDQEIEWARARPRDPCTQSGPALEEMLSKGVSREAITDLVRVFQYSALYHACSLLDGSRTVDLPVSDWTLHQLDEAGKPVAILQGLHEVLMGMDPTGREMRPRGSAQRGNVGEAE